MSNCPHCRRHPAASAAPPPVSGAVVPETGAKAPAVPAPPGEPEPPVRRWPHPVRAEPSLPEDPALRYIRSALSYQNQMLADIKALLEQIALNGSDEDAHS